MNLTVNGEPRELPDGTTVRDLLQSMRLDPRYLAAEVNREVVSRTRHAEHVLQAGDVVEIVTLVGGG
ncbi:MAG TPA: sulfur carrier protein ThiS [Planctomycetaceae bacterium]|nr:sulfur carrier protein ThiS [Planctomycetaceae bacterium]